MVEIDYLSAADTVTEQKYCVEYYRVDKMINVESKISYNKGIVSHTTKSLTFTKTFLEMYGKWELHSKIIAFFNENLSIWICQEAST